MTKLSAALGGNAGAVLAGGGMCVALALGAYIGFGTPMRTPDSDAAPAPTAQQDSSSAQTVDADQLASAEPSAPLAPSFDELRREADGTTIIAGRAEPLSDVAILLDGEQVATAKADGSGGFAAIAVLAPTAAAQVVSLSASSGEEKTASLDEIILAPAAQPVQPAPEDEAQADTQAPAAPTRTDALAQADTELPAAPTDGEPVAQTETTPAPVAVLKSDASGVQLLQAARPQAMTAIALDTIGYSDLGAVQLSGRAQADTARVRVYLDNRSVVTLSVDDDGRWRGDLPNVDEGIYTLRVDEVSAEGTVSSRVETPFKRESAEVLAQASAVQDGPVKSITVQTGATLWAIARERYGDGTLFVRVFEANADSIRNPDLIYPGQIFDLPN
ncbi:LysM peptidoglycan-binding domain-containing protein [Sulfitobacter sp. HNIBRBA2951]|uniref:LysM peptidoglycan-binding domain-containing protein n=1 Tax=Sulfitobacter aquimarinus TaxID=3158557 RepID=UPI0032DEA198